MLGSQLTMIVYIFTLLQFLNFLYFSTEFCDSELILFPPLNENGTNPKFGSVNFKNFSGVKNNTVYNKLFGPHIYDILHVTTPERFTKRLEKYISNNDDNKISFNFEICAKIPVKTNVDKKHYCKNKCNNCMKYAFHCCPNKNTGRICERVIEKCPRNEQLSNVKMKILFETNIPNNSQEDDYVQPNFNLKPHQLYESTKSSNCADGNPNDSNSTSPKWNLIQIMNDKKISSLHNENNVNNDHPLTSLPLKEPINEIMEIIITKKDSSQFDKQYELPKHVNYHNECLPSLTDVHRANSKAHLKHNRINNIQTYNSSGNNVFRIKYQNSSHNKLIDIPQTTFLSYVTAHYTENIYTNENSTFPGNQINYFFKDILKEKRLNKEFYKHAPEELVDLFKNSHSSKRLVKYFDSIKKNEIDHNSIKDFSNFTKLDKTKLLNKINMINNTLSKMIDELKLYNSPLEASYINLKSEKMKRKNNFK